MALFIISTIVFVIFAIGIQLALALWVYEDAKVKSDQSPVLWLLVAFFGSIPGFIIYLFAGRTNKEVPPPGKHKTLLIVTVVGFFITITLFFTSMFRFIIIEEGGSVPMSSGSFSMTRDRLRDDSWEFSARSANGHVRRTPTLTAAQLNNLYVTSYSGDGVTLRFEQGNIIESINLSGNVINQHINMSSFSPGRVRMKLEFNHARDIDVVISWQ